jgi:GntR family transcriptional regulator, transcriptional repressor for pyruvate dehydrogenase complex
MPDWNLADLSGLPLEPIEQSTMSELVAKRLLKLLSNGTLKAGDKIPPERDLAARLHVGRTTLREALKLLTISGLLETRRGDGTYVCGEFGNLLSHQLAWPVLLSTHDVDMVMEVRSPLEVQAARLAAERATPADLERIGVFRQLLTIEGRDTERETSLDLEFHDAIAATSRNKLLCDLMRSLHSILRQYIMLSNEMTARLQSTVAEHQKVYDAIAARDPDAAENAMKEHLAWSKDWITSGFGFQLVNQRLSNHHQIDDRP